MPKWLKGFFNVAKNSISEFFKDNALNVAAAIAYYTLQSIIPLVIGFIVVGSFFLEGEARENFVSSVKGGVQTQAFDIGKVIDDVRKAAPGLLSISAVMLLWSGSGIFDQLIFGINVIYDVKKDTRSFFKKLFLRIGLLLVVGALIAASFTITIVSQLLFSAKASIFGISPSDFSFLLPVISFLLPILLMFCVFAILYKVAPDRKDNKWSYVIPGAIVAAILFEILKYAFTLYITAFGAGDSYQKTYGSLGGIILFLLYIWASAGVMLFGAEVSSVLGGWKSVMEGPAAQQDPGARVKAEKLDSDTGPVVTGKEQARGEAKEVPATQEEGKEGRGGVPKAHDKAAEEIKKGHKEADKEKAKQPVPAYAASAQHYPAKPDRTNPVAIVIGTVALALAALFGLIFKRKDPAA